MPYTVREIRVGPRDGKPMLAKVYLDGTCGDVLTADEILTLDYVRHLEAQVAAQSSAPAAKPATPAKKGAKG